MKAQSYVTFSEQRTVRISIRLIISFSLKQESHVFEQWVANKYMQSLMNCGRRIQLGPISTANCSCEQRITAGRGLSDLSQLPCGHFLSFEGPCGSLAAAFVLPLCWSLVSNICWLKAEEGKKRHICPSKSRYLCVRSAPMWLSCWDLHISESNCSSLSRSKRKRAQFVLGLF